MSFVPPPDAPAESHSAHPFDETQWSPFWVFVLLVPAALLAVAVGVMGLWHDRNPLMLFPLAALLLTANLLCVKTHVGKGFLVVTFGAFFPLYRRRIVLSDIVSAQALTYNPLGEYGGWGIRGVKGDQCLNARGDKGVRLVLANDDELLVGTARPDELAASVRPAE